jgi:ribosomal protein L11 methyltransferase
LKKDSEIPSSLIDVNPALRAGIAVRLLAQLYPLSGWEDSLAGKDGVREGNQQDARVLHIGKRLVFCLHGTPYTSQPGEVVIRLDPGLAFGTGHHPTTRTCLQQLEHYLVPYDQVLDVGTGSGILSLAAAGLGAKSVMAIDTDPESIRSARSNVRLNRVDAIIKVRSGSVPLPSPINYAVVLANLSARLVTSLASELAVSTTVGGLMIASGFLYERNSTIAKELIGSKFKVIHSLEDSGWGTLVCKRVK